MEAESSVSSVTGAGGQAGQPEDPILGALRIRMLAPQLLAGGVAPFAVYQLAHHSGLSDASSLATATIVPALWVVGNWAWRRRLDVIPGLALIGITVGLIGVVALHGSEIVLKMRESLITGVFGIVFLTSLLVSDRPIIYHLGRAIASGQGGGSRADFETLWGEENARRVIRRLTLVWGIALTGEAVLRTILALTVPTGTFLALAPVIGWVIIGSMMWFTVSYIRNSRAQAAALAGAEAAVEVVSS
jgi:hypothetical protein